MNKPDLLRVRELLASTEALLKDVQAAIAEARRLHEQARALQGNDPAPRREGPTSFGMPSR